jgi:hypothetical protein
LDAATRKKIKIRFPIGAAQESKIWMVPSIDRIPVLAGKIAL